MSEKTKKSVVTEQLSPMFTFANIAVLAVIAAVIATALLSYHPTDPAWSHNEGGAVQNTLGSFGAWYSDLSFSLIGKLSYLIPIGLVILAAHFWLEKGINKELLSWRLFMLLTAILSGCVLWAKHDPVAINTVAQTGGGALGAWLTIGLEKTIKSVPVIMAFSTIVFAISVSLLFNIPWLKFAEWMGRGIAIVIGSLFAGFVAGREKKKTHEKSMTSNMEETIENDNDNEDLQDKIRQLNALAENNESKKPSFTIDRYEADESILDEQIQTPPPSMADSVTAPEPILTPTTPTAEPEAPIATPETIVSEVQKPQTIPTRQPAEQPTPQPIPLAQPEPVRPTIAGTPAQEEAAPIAFDRVTPQEVPNIDTSYKEQPQKTEPSFFDFGGLKSTFKSLRNRPEVPSEKTAQTTIDTEIESTPIIEPIAEPVKPLAEDFTAIEEPVIPTVAATVPVIEPIITPAVGATSIETSAEPSVEINHTPTTNIPVDTAIEPTPELVSALMADDIKPQATAPIEKPAAEIVVERIAEPVPQPVAPVTQPEPQIVPQAAAQPTPPTPIAPAVTSAAAATSSTSSTVSIGKAYDASADMAEEIEQRYELPGIGLLDTPPPQVNAYTEDVLAEMAEVLERTLKYYKVDATVMHVSPGPVITRFEIDLAPGTQAKKITALSNDLARALAVSGVRVEEVIPGNSYVGLEVPNKQRQIVYFRDVVCSKAFQSSKSPLTVSLGSDTSGKPVVADLMKMPHSLVAGTTGSGKSVCINVMLLSMLFKATPKDLRLILVDPKMLEMSMYEDIPHLLTPVITDMNEAENALTWAVAEMERRYQLMAALKVRKIDAFNETVDAANERGEPIKDPLWQPDESVGYTHHPNLERLPFIVIVIDELADMMMVVGKQVEQLIARLTQKARAAGIHVVLATQRPSTDVLTGLIKANVPTRIAFQVSSGTDSRVIIDGVGAEKLLGHGDMLYVPPGAGHPQRLHGAFVGDAETDRITNYIRSMGEPDYINGITGKQDPETLGAYGAAEAAEAKDDADELYGEAVQIVLETGKASISSVQRHLRIGYNRAARMIEDMQEQGIVSEPVNGVRKVLGAPRPPE